MPVARPDQYAAMLDDAAAGGFAAAGADGIVQVTVGGAGYLSGGGSAHAPAGPRDSSWRARSRR